MKDNTVKKISDLDVNALVQGPLQAVLPLLKAPMPVKDRLSMLAGMVAPFYGMAAAAYKDPAAIKQVAEQFHSEVIQPFLDALTDESALKEFKNQLMQISEDDILDILHEGMTIDMDSMSGQSKNVSVTLAGRELTVDAKHFSPVQLAQYKKDFHISEDDIAFVQSGAKAVLASLKDGFGPLATAFKLDITRLKTAVLDVKTAQAESNLSKLEKLDIGLESKEELCAIFARHAYGAIEGFDPAAMAKKGREIRRKVTVAAVNRVALAAVNLPDAALKSMVTKDYSKLNGAWNRLVENVTKPTITVASVTDLLPPLQPLVDDLAQHATVMAAKLRGPQAV